MLRVPRRRSLDFLRKREVHPKSPRRLAWPCPGQRSLVLGRICILSWLAGGSLLLPLWLTPWYWLHLPGACLPSDPRQVILPGVSSLNQNSASCIGVSRPILDITVSCFLIRVFGVSLSAFCRCLSFSASIHLFPFIKQTLTSNLLSVVSLLRCLYSRVHS
ncbi:hypothetical protein IWZ00DRAFT_373551 [Phyllosticta capitalensis]